MPVQSSVYSIDSADSAQLRPTQALLYLRLLSSIDDHLEGQVFAKIPWYACFVTDLVLSGVKEEQVWRVSSGMRMRPIRQLGISERLR